MKQILYILFFTFLFQNILAQKPVPSFEVYNSSVTDNSTLGGSYIENTNNAQVYQSNLLQISELSDGDYILLEINREDKKTYSLEMIDEAGDILIAIDDFNSASMKIVKNNLHKGQYTVYLTDRFSNTLDIGIIHY